MLVRFVVSNYLSFGEETEFNMLTGSVRRKKEHIYQFGDIELLKTAAIYGPNGAGKSNLIRAILLLKEIVTNDMGLEEYYIDSFRLEPFYKKTPTQLEIEFIKDNKNFSYGVSIQNGIFLEEWLFETGIKKEKLIFERKKINGQTKIKVTENLFQSAEDKLRIKLYEEELLADNKPLLKMFMSAKKVYSEIKMVFDWFEDDLKIIDAGSKVFALPLQYYFSDTFKAFVNDIFKTFQTGIKRLELKSIGLDLYFGVDDSDQAEEIKRQLNLKDNTIENSFKIIHEPGSNHLAFAVKENDKVVVKRLVSIHETINGQEIEFEIGEESDGTQRILDFLPVFFDVFLEDKTIIIDEIDQSLHPHLLKKIIDKFVNDNNTKGQLIFTTHDSNLLDQNTFRQDEIWFTEKKKTGETTMYPLSDFKIRYDLDIEKGYLKGRFGAIPFLGNFDDLNWHQYAS